MATLDGFVLDLKRGSEAVASVFHGNVERGFAVRIVDDTTITFLGVVSAKACTSSPPTASGGPNVKRGNLAQ